jgi:hypothetical protein
MGTNHVDHLVHLPTNLLMSNIIHPSHPSDTYGVNNSNKVNMDEVDGWMDEMEEKRW